MSVLGFPSSGDIVLPQVVPSSEVVSSEPTTAELERAENNGISPWVLDETNAHNALDVLYTKGEMPYDTLLSRTAKTIGGLVLWTTTDAKGYWASDDLSPAEMQVLDTALRHAEHRVVLTVSEPPEHNGFSVVQRAEAVGAGVLSAGGGALAYLSESTANLLSLGVGGLIAGGVLGVGSILHGLYKDYRYRRDELPELKEDRRQLTANIDEYGVVLSGIAKKVMDASVFIPNIPVGLSLKKIKKSNNPQLGAFEDVMREELAAIDLHYKEAKEKNGGCDETLGKFLDAVEGGAYNDVSVTEFMRDMYQAIRTDMLHKKNRKDAFEFNPLEALYDMVRSVPNGAGESLLANIWNDNPSRKGMKTHLATIGRIQTELDEAEKSWHMLRCADNGGLSMKNDPRAEKIANQLLEAKEEDLAISVLGFIAFRQKIMRDLAAGILIASPQETWSQPPGVQAS